MTAGCPIVGGAEQPAEGGSEAEAAEEVAGDILLVRLLGLLAGTEHDVPPVAHANDDQLGAVSHGFRVLAKRRVIEQLAIARLPV